MKPLEQLTAEDIHNMSYNELVSITRETNRPPGGLKTIKTVTRELGLTSDHSILEIGTSTGFTAIELARLAHSKVTAIDINEVSISEAKKRAESAEVSQRVDFRVGNAMDLQLPPNQFDVVFCGNVTSYIPDPERARSEYIRVLKEGGHLVAVPMYYVTAPPANLVSRVSEAIKFPVKVDSKKRWIDFFTSEPLVHHFSEDYLFDSISSERADAFAEEILSSPHLVAMDQTAKSELHQKYRNSISLFAENLKYMGYTILIARKENFRFDSELFTGTKVATHD